MIRRVILVVFCCSLVVSPIAAQQAASDSTQSAQPDRLSNLNLRRIAFDAARTVTAEQTTQTPQPTTVASSDSQTKVLYAISLGAAAGGTIYNIRKTREGLDRKLEVRTFPLVWLKTSDPADKGKVSALIGGVNGGLMAVSALAYRSRNTSTAIMINVLVAAATIAVGLNDRNKINDDKKACPIVSACR